VTTPAELFGEQLPALLAGVGEGFPGASSGPIGFRLTGAGGGEWTVDLAAQPPSCTPGWGSTVRCTVELPAADLEALLATPEGALRLYAAGRLTLSGESGAILGLQALLAAP
jgi:hypothetical protein